MIKVLVIGGPGTISSSTIQDLLDRECATGVFSRRDAPAKELDAGIITYIGDRNNTTELETAIDNFKPDVVIDFVLFLPQQAKQIISLVSGKVKQYIFVSTVDVYGYPLSRLPFRESDPWMPPISQYAADKRACEEIFRAKFGPSLFPLTIVRPAYSFGPRFLLSFFSRKEGLHLIPRLRAGNPVIVPGDGTTLMHVSSAYNTGRMIAAIAGQPQTIGQDYTCGHDTFMTGDGYIKLMAKAVGVEPNIVHIPTDVLMSINYPEKSDWLLNELTRHNVAFSVERFKADFSDFEWTMSLEEAMKNVIEWNEQNSTMPALSEELFDDKIIAAWQRQMQSFTV